MTTIMDKQDKKLPYTGLRTTRKRVESAPLLQASVRQNKREVGNNGWQHDATDDKALGITGESPFTVVFE